MRPVYFIVVSVKTVQPYGWQLNTILRVFSCDLADVNELYQRHVIPLFAEPSAGPIQTYIFEREPANPLQALAEPAESEAR